MSVLAPPHAELATLYALAPLMMGVVEVRGDDVLHVSDNPATAAFFGAPPDATRGRFATELGVPPDHLALWVDRYREARETGAPVSFDYPHASAGGPRWLRATVAHVDGDRFAYVVEEVTEVVEKDAELRDGLARQEALLRALPDLMFRLGRDGRYLDVHAPDAGALVAPREALLGRTIREKIPGPLAERFHAAMDRSLATGALETVEYDLETDDGTRHVFEARVSPAVEREEVLVIVRDRTSQVADRRALEAMAERLQALVANLQAAVLFEDEARRLLLANERFCETFGVGAPPDTLVGADCAAALEAALPFFADPEGARARVEATLRARTSVRAEQVSFADGRVFERDYVPVALGDGHGGHLWLYHDVSERVAAERQRRDREARYRLLAENMQDLVALHDPDGTYQWLSPSVEALLGYAPEALVGTSPYALLHPDDADAVRAGSHAAARRGRTPDPAVYRIRRADGRYVWFETLTQPISDDDGAVACLQTCSRDVTDRVEMEDRLFHQAFHDPLTDLPNRALFVARLEEAIARRRGPDGFAVLFLDLDRFKVVNDTLGHTAGDRLLREVAGRLRQALRAGDTVARFGGDEFAVLLSGLPDDRYAETVAHRVLDVLRPPVRIDGRDLFAGASVGVVVGRPEHDDPDVVLREADLAMYRAKENGRGTVASYSAAVHAAVTQRLRLEMDLRHAVERGELRVVYQPIVRLADGSLAGFEALVRWEHPTFGLLAPDAFLGPAEESNQLPLIDRWVLGEACRAAASWNRAAARPLTVHVNCSGRDLLGPTYADEVLALAAAHGLGPGELSLELTEQVLVDDTDAAAAALRALKAGGISCSLDDFGTGYSSLSTLHSLPVDSIKIDRSFVSEMSSQAQSRGLVETVVHLGRVMGKAVVAEGIEGPDQLAALRGVGCAFGQGYLFDRPLDGAAAAALAAQAAAPWGAHWAAA